MYYNIHSDFILAPIIEVLADGVNACKGVGYGMETQPLSEYVLSALFLRATGALEQKLKCICWEIATHDYDFRYQFMRGDFQLGEYSDYKSKNKIYNFLIRQIIKLKKTKLGYTVDDKTKDDLIQEVISNIETLFEDTNILEWEKNSFIFYKANVFNRLSKEQILANSDKSGRKLLESSLQKDYDEIVYKHRNRLAHNTSSYQRNLPTLEVLATEEYKWHNYFYRYSLLFLIDLIFIHLYREYRESFESYSVHP